MLTRRLLLRSAFGSLPALNGIAAYSGPAFGQAHVVYVATPHETVDRMLRLARLTSSDFLIDLGSGDGRIPIAAARNGARALGIEIDPERLREAQANARAAGVTDRVSFRQEDLFKTPLGEATVITLYLLPELNARLAPRLLSLRPGTRIVSHLFPMGDWKPDVTDADGGVIYLWIVPAQVAGRWQLQTTGGPLTLELEQRYQDISGRARLPGGATVPVREGRLRGASIEFTLDLGGQATSFSGTFDGSRMQAAAPRFGFAQSPPWSATRM
jgi:hypothetical protein